MKKRISAFLLIVLMMLSINTGVFAVDDIKVYINDQLLTFDVAPQIIDGRTMVPMRKIFESLGAVVSWDDASRTATGKKGNTTINVTIDSKVLFKNSVPMALDVAPVVVDDRTLVPARAIAESFDCKVEWFDETRTVKITTGENFDHTKEKLTASEIAERVSPSVFYVEVYNERGRASASGSGFFVTSDGVAVTNYHVIEDTYSAKITMTSGDVHNVERIIAFDKDLDIAIIRISKTSENGKAVDVFPTLELGDSDSIKAGQTIYALGSPAGLQNTISNGIISNINRQLEGNSFIQITAPISHGSSGGALVNEYGEVLGITSAGIEDAENIGFAIPINTIKSFDLTVPGFSYVDFANGKYDFTLELSETIVNIAVGEKKEILVHAEGKGNWSIYWDTKQTELVNCEWGKWRTDAYICPLIITGVREGTATITVYSDVDFNGKNITVNVNAKQNNSGNNSENNQSSNYYPSDYYPSSLIKVPTYTAVMGESLIRIDNGEKNNFYVYRYYSTMPVKKYMEFLETNGFKYVTAKNLEGALAYFYEAPNGEAFCIVMYELGKELWIVIPK